MVGCLAAPAGAIFDPSPLYEVKAQSAYIVNTDTNIILYEKDSTAQVPAGGLTKLMCAALVLTNYGDELDSRTFQMPFAISDYVYGTDNADMRSGETFTLREALYAMLLRNANDAAMGMAYQLSGQRPGRLGEPDEQPVPADRRHRQHLDRRLRPGPRQHDQRGGYVPDPAVPDGL